MSEREQLREAIAADVLVMHYQDAGRAQREGKIVACSCGFDGNYVTWRRHVADAVLAVLDQQEWVSAEDANRVLAGACPYCTHNGGFVLVEASELAALREAARYEPIDGWCWDGFWFHRRGDDCGKFCMPIARQVTEGEEL